MKKINWFLTAVIVFAACAFVRAQNKMLTIDDIFDPQKRVNFSGRPLFVEWNKDGTTFRQVQNQSLMRVNALTGEAASAFDNKKLVSVLTQTSGFSLDEANRLGASPAQQFNNAETAILINHKNDLYLYEIASGVVRRLTNTPGVEETEADFSPDDKAISFVRGNNLFVVDAASGRETQLTRDGGEKIINGVLDWVYEEELYGRGNKRGYWWSPDSKRIAFLRTDESPVPKFVLPDDTVADQRVENTDYPQSGDPNPLVRLGLADVSGSAAKFADLSNYKPEDLLLVRVIWSPDSKNVIFQAQNREQTRLDLNAADSNGKVTKILTETSSAWVAALDNPTFLKDGSMIWQSERSGFNRLYHYGRDGKLIRLIADGAWETVAFYGVDEARGYVYFSANGENNDWVSTHVYRVKLDGTGFQRLTKEAGTHRASFNSTFTHFIDNWSDTNTPTQTRLYRADGTLERVLNENKVEALSQYKLGKTQFLKVKTRDNFEMEAMMILPPDFDANKKYPVLAYTYSGPQAPSVRNSWGGSRYLWHQMMAQKGYIIWICDNRTASAKGVATAWKGYQKFGQLETQDLEDGFNYLKSQSFVDGNRLGMWGWSYGGFMTSYFMTHSKTLKAGIAGGLVGDWALYDSIYTERYMRTPQNNPQGYKDGSVIAAAKDLSGKILIIHGQMDDNVHMQNATQLIFELQKAGKQFELMYYPTQRHGVVNPLQAKHMYQMMADFVMKNL